MKRLGFVRRVDETVKIIIAEDGRKLGCPYRDGEPCGTWCALFDVVVYGGGGKVARCGATNLGEVIEDTVPKEEEKSSRKEDEDKTALCTKATK